jgi:hypothetical protein
MLEEALEDDFNIGTLRADDLPIFRQITAEHLMGLEAGRAQR